MWIVTDLVPTKGIAKPLSAAARSPKYLKVYVVLDKALYNYMGSDTNAATRKIIQVFNLVNNMFNPLNVTIVLSSLELWTEENKISTAGEADDLLQRFLQWKQSHLTLGSYDIAYLLLYRDQAAFVGATDLGKACQRDAAGAVAMYQGAVTLESFSVLLAQLLGRSLGISYDDSRDCRCPGRVCLMSPEALHVSGAKAFSSCSIGDFETFLKHNGGTCLFNRPRLTGLSYRRVAVCGNGIVERGEQCDCGAAEACLEDKCCTKMCRFKPGVKCSSGLCCNECQVQKMLLWLVTRSSIVSGTDLDTVGSSPDKAISPVLGDRLLDFPVLLIFSYHAVLQESQMWKVNLHIPVQHSISIRSCCCSLRPSARAFMYIFGLFECTSKAGSSSGSARYKVWFWKGVYKQHLSPTFGPGI
ncbi:disintegrin and metalloproteinase domain-containing protein 2-like isoform X5 [Buteo buteo]|uniref:disintegrin and metalloproteinase domain-containing protein 2-like isoform X5 n=1 Tax=Buteo buteo TaxID=30397 RepID=UPI003EBD8DBD